MKVAILVLIQLVVLATSQREVENVSSSSDRAAQRQRYWQRRNQLSRITREYENMYYKLAPQVYDQMIGASKSCDQELKMDSEEVKSCVEKKMNAILNNKKKQDKDKAKNTRNKRQAPVDPSTTTPAPIVSDMDDANTTAVPMAPEVNAVKSWRDVLRTERLVVGCFVEGMRKTEFRDLGRKEWRETRDQKYLELMKSRSECLKNKLKSS